MKTVCVYHSIDLDGWLSAAIVKYWFEEREIKTRSIGVTGLISEKPTIDFIGYNYNHPIPDLSEYDKVIMCDISFPKDELLKINIPNDRLTWIDHHASALKEFYEKFDTIEATTKYFKGLRSSKFAACELTWMYFFPNKDIPELVRLLGRYDCFGHKGTEEEQYVLEFQYGARQYISNYEQAYTYLVESISKQNESDVLKNIHDVGKNIYNFLCVEAKQIYRSRFEILLNEAFNVGAGLNSNLRKFACINRERFNPINFGIDYHKDGYEGCAAFYFDGKVFHFSIYNDNSNVDCSVIAKFYNGGGHKGAAGFRLSSEEFYNLIR